MRKFLVAAIGAITLPSAVQDPHLLAYSPQLKSRAAEWESKRELFELALASADPAVEVGKFLPFKL